MCTVSLTGMAITGPFVPAPVKLMALVLVLEGPLPLEAGDVDRHGRIRRDGLFLCQRHERGTNRAVTVIAGTIVHRISSGLLPWVCVGQLVVSGLRRKRSVMMTEQPSTRTKTITAMTKVSRYRLSVAGPADGNGRDRRDAGAGLVPRLTALRQVRARDEKGAATGQRRTRDAGGEHEHVADDLRGARAYGLDYGLADEA